MGYYPYADAAQSFSGLGQHLASIALNSIVQRQRLAQTQQYQQAQTVNMQELRRQEAQKIALQQALNNAQIGHFNASAGEASARQAIEASRDANATAGGNAFADQYVNGLPPLPQGPTFSGGNISTPIVGQRDTMRGIVAALMQAQLRAQNGGDPNKVANFINMQDAMNAAPMTPQLGQAIRMGAKPIAIAKGGGAYNPATDSINAIMPQEVPAGASVFPFTDGTPGTPVTAPGKPLNPFNAQQAFTSAANALAHLSVGGSMPDEKTQPDQFRAYTNSAAILRQAGDLLQQQMRGTNTATSIAPTKVRVKTSDGRAGIMNSDEVPSDWTIVGPAQ